jgi:hypothetical protein
MAEDCLLATQSNCSRAVNSFHNLPLVSFNRFNLPFLPNSSQITLRALNLGTGTTGTRSINQRICHVFKIKTLHYDKECNTNHTLSAVVEQWIVNLVLCSTKRCFSAHFLNSYPQILQTILTRYEYVSDFPMGEIFADLIFFVPNLIVISSLRDPKIWARRRLHEHAQTPICHPSLWNHSLVHHPFDLIACLTLRRYTNDALVPISDFTEHIDQLISAYIQYNSFNYVLSLSRNMAYYPLCLWDSHISHDSGKALLSDIWARHPETRSFLFKATEPPKPINRPQWLVNASLPAMRRRFRFKYESELGQEPPDAHGGWSAPQSKVPTLANSRITSSKTRVVFIAPRDSDLVVLSSFLCGKSEIEPTPRPCREITASLSSPNSYLAMSQRWHQHLSACLKDPSPLECQPSVLLVEHAALLDGLLSSPASVLSAAVGDHLQALLLAHQLLHSVASAQPPFLLVTLYYPSLVPTTLLSESQETTIVCHPSLWAQSHPFDLVTCLHSTSSISRSLVSLSSLSSQQFHQAVEASAQLHSDLRSQSALRSHVSLSVPSLIVGSQETLSCTLSRRSYLLQLKLMLLLRIDDSLSGNGRLLSASTSTSSSSGISLPSLTEYGLKERVVRADGVLCCLFLFMVSVLWRKASGRMKDLPR